MSGSPFVCSWMKVSFSHAKDSCARKLNSSQSKYCRADDLPTCEVFQALIAAPDSVDI